MRLAWPLLILLLAGASGCAPVSPVSDYCLTAKPIVPTRDERAMLSEETERQIDQHNSDWVCRCEHDCQ